VTAVNLGGDTDTVGAVTGALCGAYYGLSQVPQRWLEVLQDREEIMQLAEGIYKLSQAG
jgi:ADP-ribosyl-[dinitrogen reductase] hydrolase